MPIVVMTHHASDMAFSSVVPKKGVHPYAVIRASNDLALIGHSKVILQSDNGPATVSFGSHR